MEVSISSSEDLCLAFLCKIFFLFHYRYTGKENKKPMHKPLYLPPFSANFPIFRYAWLGGMRGGEIILL